MQGLQLHKALLSRADGAQLLQAIDALAWDKTLKRKVQHYGYTYDYKTRTITKTAPLPDFFAPVVDKLLEHKLLDQRPDQLIVNNYEPGQGISAHIDAPSMFRDGIVSVSLGSPCVMTFRKPGQERVDVWLDVGSALVLRGEARYEWTHEIAARKSDVWQGSKRTRSRRVSLTFRKTVAG